MATGESSFTRTYGPLLTMTLDEILSSGAIQDNVYQANPTLDWFNSGNRIKVLQGGERIRIPVMTGTNGTFKWYSQLDTLNITPSLGFTTAWYQWKQAAVSIAIDGLTVRQNMGPTQIADIMKEKSRQAELSLVDGIATGLFSDGSGSSNKQLTGLEAALPDDPTSDTTYAEINQSDNTSWRSQIQSSVGAAATNLIPKMRTVWNDCGEGKSGSNSSPDYIVTTQTVHESFEALIAPRVRYEPNPSGGADAGVEKLLFKGATVVMDNFCGSGNMYMLNGSHIMLFVHAKANMAMTEEGFQKPIDQDALVAQILFQGNIAVNNRRKLGKLTGIT